MPPRLSSLSDLIRGCDGVDSGDTNLVQTHPLLTIAAGGACVRVPEAYLAEALEIIAALKRGEYQREEDFDFDAGET